MGDGVSEELRRLAGRGNSLSPTGRRARTELDIPEAYVLGEWDFYNITVKVTPDVLIPRPDTEHVVDVALSYLRCRAPCAPGGQEEKPLRLRSQARWSYEVFPSLPVDGAARVLDLCCGCGCIGLAIEANCPGVSVVYGDVSEAALAVARDNGCEDARLLDALNPPPDGLGLFDALVCNPPYVAPGDGALDASVPDWEPHIALFGGADGLDFFRSLLPGWLAVLKPGGLFAAEVGYDQAGTVSQMARDAGLSDVTVRKDYAGYDRVIFGVK